MYSKARGQEKPSGPRQWQVYSSRNSQQTNKLVLARCEPPSVAPAGPCDSSGRVSMLVESKGKPENLNQGTDTITLMPLKSHFVVRTITVLLMQRAQLGAYRNVDMLAVEVEEGWCA